jgi:hypothetical protein
MGEAAGRSRKAIGRKKTGDERKGEGARRKVQAFTPRRLPKPSLYRDEYIFWQRAMVVKR